MRDPNGAKGRDPIPSVLALNKLDLIEEMTRDQLEDYQVQENLDAFASETGFIGAVRCSAKTD